ncbi:MAG: response regulator [Phototrophicaceae bacterium]
MSKYTVLSIDDDESARTLFEMMLKRSGFNVVQAVDADDALEKLENLVPDLIMTDIQLPGMNGLELTSLIRERPEFNNIPIIVLSAFQSATILEDVRKVGGDKFIKKPLPLTGLNEKLSTIIENKREE